MSGMNELQESLRAFAKARNWGKFHTPNNLGMALAGEVGELLAEMQWISDEEFSQALDEGLRDRLTDEVADVLIYLLYLADQLGVDPVEAAHDKLLRNESRYPVEESFESAVKYSDRGSSQ